MSGSVNGNENSKEVEKIIEQTENSDKKIYPILKPGNWVGLKAGALSNTLIPSENGAEVVIAYGMDTPDNFVFLTQKHLETMDGQQITSEAFENLGNYEAELEFVGSLDNKAVATNGNDFSSEIILSKAHMLKAHAMLDAEELLVSIPRRTCMTIISRDVDEETMNKFAYLHNFTWEDDSFGNAPITNSLFIVKEGTIVGHIPL
ncbi:MULTISPECIES: DUF1444 family protein [unclassified Polaribacter]|jgi:uncharacterized protein YtpQ (UPF0354 family)|uniref:DUF1444 family protein n=1 Tax=unclassified Polaribacter TaxID=196858 RepID=UPI001C4E7986|nr:MULTISPECIES: DUF1444 family protein [unclassified Polaribacter]QXP65136.1 DUF1444 family protein [Polaribacter sp. HaHaR_3_91]QXP67631.1 DUF1444 family protein [Polaribacter sp. AHE13PA]QXP69789.1 DUF1444 family protein [Polaribacter sp. R2A056_3_33]